MSKRNPTSDLNHDNWDQPDEKEDAGHFKSAAEDVLKKREIRVAKRRALGSEEKGSGGLFKSFTGFTGGSGAEAGTGNSSGGIAGFGFGKAPAAAPAFNFKPAAAAPPSGETPTTDGAATALPKPPPATSADPNTAHLAQLKSLNESVLRWIQSHLDDSPHCVLTPVFRDYERHLADIERRHPYVEPDGADSVKTNAADAAAAESAKAPDTAAVAKASPTVGATKETTAAPTLSTATTTVTSAPSTIITAASTAAPVMPPSFSFNFSASGGPTTAAAPASATAATTVTATDAAAPAAAAAPPAAKTTAAFFFGGTAPATSTSMSASTPPLPGFTFGAGSAAAPTASGLSLFGGFGSGAPSTSASAVHQQEDEEEYEPPKPESREIREAGAVFSQRCKLFYMSEGKQWREKGVGSVHVKPSEGAGRAQLIVRADNTLGTILLNTLITKDMTLSVTKNNLSLACVPNPPLQPKSAGADSERRLVPFLVRLKVESDAKELLAKINQLREA